MDERNPKVSSEQFDTARKAFFSWENFDDHESEFLVRNLHLILRSTNTCIAMLIPAGHTGGGKGAYVFVREPYTSLLSAYHIGCADLPADGVWTQDMHDKNLARFISAMSKAEDVREVTWALRQLTLYKQVVNQALDLAQAIPHAKAYLERAKPDDQPEHIEALQLFVDSTPVH